MINIIIDNIRLTEIIADYNVTKEIDDDVNDDADGGNYDGMYLIEFLSRCVAFIPSDI